jgi:hypothetical protein
VVLVLLVEVHMLEVEILVLDLAHQLRELRDGQILVEVEVVVVM